MLSASRHSTGAGDVAHRPGSAASRRSTARGGCRSTSAPREAVAFGHREPAPAFIAVEHLRVALANIADLIERAMTSATSLVEGQMSRRKHGPVDADAERPLWEVDIDAAASAYATTSRRRGEVVGAHFLLNPALELRFPESTAQTTGRIADRRRYGTGRPVSSRIQV